MVNSVSKTTWSKTAETDPLIEDSVRADVQPTHMHTDVSNIIFL